MEKPDYDYLSKTRGFCFGGGVFCLGSCLISMSCALLGWMEKEMVNFFLAVNLCVPCAIYRIRIEM